MKIVKLSDLTPISAEVEVGDGVGIRLYPLTMLNLTELFLEAQDELVSLYAQSQQPEPDFTTAIVTAPRLVAKIIAVSARSPESIDVVQGLPAANQLIAISKVWEISAPDPKKLVEAVLSITNQIVTATGLQLPEQKPLEQKIEKPLNGTSPQA